jgi:integrating conjugative element protein (TIGR03757 family)
MHIPINKARCALHRFSVSTGALGPQDGAPLDAGMVRWLVTLSGRNQFNHFVGLVRLILLTLAASMILIGHIAQADQPGTNPPRVIEVFTATDRPVSASTIDRLTGQAINIELQVYRIDGIQQLEAALSRHLSSDPAVAKRVALDRIQQLDNQSTTRLRNAAIGLTKALQYGIDRYPAIVFDGQCVVYGVTDLGQALHRYHLWQGRA